MKKCFPLFLASLFVSVAGQLQARDVLIPVDSTASAVAAANKGHDLVKKGDLEGARRLFDAAIHADPKLFLAIYARGEISMHQHKWEQAIQDFNSALGISPGFFIAAVKRGQANERLGRYDRSLADYDKVISLQPMIGSRALAKSARAWLRATCPNPAFRNGQQAVADAKAACNLTSWDNGDYIDTLAAAYAEAGDFDAAVKFEKKAISKTRDADSIKSAQQRLALYEQHHPHREVAG
jgi:tetratricopeptide (TPR) repeat protein